MENYFFLKNYVTSSEGGVLYNQPLPINRNQERFYDNNYFLWNYQLCPLPLTASSSAVWSELCSKYVNFHITQKWPELAGKLQYRGFVEDLIIIWKGQYPSSRQSSRKKTFTFQFEHFLQKCLFWFSLQGLCTCCRKKITMSTDLH